MLQKMGLDEDKKIGKNTENALVKPIEYIPRPAKSGLGSLPNLVYHKLARLINQLMKRLDYPEFKNYKKFKYCMESVRI